MNIYIIIIFGILGIGIGFLIPDTSDRIVIYKNKKRYIETITCDFNSNTWELTLILNGLLWVYVGIRLENIFTALLVSILFTVAILISIIDLRIRLIPNELVLFMFCLGILFQILYFGWMELLSAFICMAAVGTVFTLVGRFVGYNQVGAGDVKLAATMGLVLGYPSIMIALIGMSAALLIYCFLGLALKKLTMHSMFPFAPFIMFGMICSLIYIVGKI